MFEKMFKEIEKKNRGAGFTEHSLMFLYRLYDDIYPLKRVSKRTFYGEGLKTKNKVRIDIGRTLLHLCTEREVPLTDSDWNDAVYELTGKRCTKPASVKKVKNEARTAWFSNGITVESCYDVGKCWIYTLRGLDIKGLKESI